MTQRGLFIFVVALSAGAAHASEGAPHAVEIPWRSIVIQTANLGGLLVVLGFLLRKKMAQYFGDRRDVYLDLVRRADAARQEAEANKREISSRLENLQTTTKRSIEQAHAEAEDLRQKIIAEAKQLAEKLKEEAGRAAQIELERARATLRRDLLTAATEAARAQLKESVGGAEQKKLQSEFVEKIQVVQ